MLRNSNAKYKKQILSSIPATEILPYLYHIDPYTIKTDKGDLVMIYEIDGVDFSTQEEDEIYAWSLSKQKTWKALNSPDLSIWTHLIHEKYNGTKLPAQFKNKICQEIYDKYNERVVNNLYVNRYFISIVMSGSRGLEAVRDMIDKGGVVETELMAKRLKQKARILESDFIQAGINPLILQKEDGSLVSEAAELIARIYNGKWERQPILQSNLNETLPSVGLLATREVIEQWDVADEQSGAILVAQDYDRRTHPNQFNELLTLNFPFILSQSYSFIPHVAADIIVSRMIKDMEGSQDKAQDRTDELDHLRKLMAGGDLTLGTFHITFHSSDKDINTAVHNLDEASSILRKGGVNMKRSIFAAESDFLGQFPGNHKDVVYTIDATDENFSHFNSFHNYPINKPNETYWGDAVCLIPTVANTPDYISWHDYDVGHTIILGETGSGKTVTQNMLLLFSQKFDPLLTIFDAKRNAEVLVKLLKGKYFNFEIGVPTHLAPFQMEPTEANKSFCKDLAKIMVTAIEKKITLEEIEQINWAIDQLMNDLVPIEERTVTRLGEFLTNQGENNLYEKLHLWMKGGKLGWVFDNNKDLLDLNSNTIGFNTDNILDMDEAKSPVMAYLWYRIEARKTGKKSMIVFEEFHQTLEDDYFVNKMKKGLKMDRDKNIMYIFTSQSPSDAIDSKIAKTIVEQIGTSIFLSNPKAEYEDYKRFKTTRKEFNIIKTSTRGSRRFVLKKGNKSSVHNFNLEKIKEYLPYASAGKNLIHIFEECVEKYGDDKWEKPYLEEAKNV